MLSDILDFLENEKNRKFQIIGKVEQLIESENLIDPEMPTQIMDKINSINRTCQDKIIEVDSPFTTQRMEFAKQFNSETGSVLVHQI
jgi:hypothetical protein